MFGLVERFIILKLLYCSSAVSSTRPRGSAVRFTDEELKHQALFRRIERLIAEHMPDGYQFVAKPNDVAWLVLGKSTWAVLALTCMIELFTQAHYRESIAWDANLSALYKDIFLFHWKEESQHAILDELEWRRENATLDSRELDAAVDDLIELVGAVDGMSPIRRTRRDLFLSTVSARTVAGGACSGAQTLLRAYRWQSILSGARASAHTAILTELVSDEQGTHRAALAPIAEAAGPR